MIGEQFIGFDNAIVHEHISATEAGSEQRDPITVVKLTDTAGNETFESIPGAQDLEPGTPVFLARIETEEGSRTEIVPKELF